MNHNRTVILGNSAAGITALETLLEKTAHTGLRHRISLVDSENCPAYSRVLTTYLLAGSVTARDLFIKDWQYYKEMGIRTYFGRSAVGLDTVKQRVVLDDDTKLSYDRLCIATGASAVVLARKCARKARSLHRHRSESLSGIPVTIAGPAPKYALPTPWKWKAFGAP